MKSVFFRACCLLYSLFLLAAVSLAEQTYTGTVPFQTSDQPAWMGDKSASYTFGTSWDESKDASDSIDTWILGKWGGGLDASCKGGMSLTFTGKVRDSKINLSYPITLTLTYPDNGILYPGDIFTISTAFAPSTASSMTVSSLSASMDVSSRLWGDYGLDAWLELASQDVFDGEVFGIDFDTGTQTLISSDWRDSWHRNLDNILILDVQKPVVNAAGSLSGTNVVATGRGKLGSMYGNITNAACKLAGLPTPNKSDSKDIGVTVSYETKLASLEADLDFFIGQSYTFAPTPTVTLKLSTGQQVALPLGQTINFTMPSVPAGTPTNNITFTPTCSLPNSLTNSTDLIIGSGLYFDPFTAKASMGIKHVGDVDLNFDPVGRYSLISGEMPVTLYSDSMQLGGFAAPTLSPFILQGYIYPKPAVSYIWPYMIRKGSGKAKFIVHGSNFVSKHGINPSTKVLWDGAERVTDYYLPGKVQSYLSAADTNVEGIHQVSVINPPPGGGVSATWYPYIVDGTAPVTTNTHTGPEGLRGWFVGDVQVDLSATDNLCGTASTTYTVDDETPVTQGFAVPKTAPPFSGPFNTDTFTVTGDLIHTVTYNSKDNVGNTEALREQIIKIDTTLPELTESLSPSTLWPPNSKMVRINVWGTMTDNLSGVDRDSAYFQVIDEYGLVQPTGPVPVAEDGTYQFSTMLEARRLGTDSDGRTYTVHVCVRDMAGLWNSVSQVVIVPRDQR